MDIIESRRNQNIVLRPWYYASVSGGKDSLYMLGLILTKPDYFPLDCVVHFKLETDFPFVRKVMEFVRGLCEKYNIAYMEITPRVPFADLCIKYGAPTRVARWCNSAYKLDCKRQLNKIVRSRMCRPVAYIGFGADELKRCKHLDNPIQVERYPLVELGVTDAEILAMVNKHSELFGDFYKYHKRQGCWVCPLQSMSDLAYLRKFHRDKFDTLVMLARAKEENEGLTMFDRPIDNILKNLEKERYKL